ncbi:MAG: ferrous iron transport protein B [Prevotellaceae bacterium]|jgi:ferrous iron transport protein B|nr:ferrous iron transport protein B [Prevotellaceae bacterium]
MKLSELKTGEKGYIIKVFGYGGFRKRIVEMGFIKGKEVEVLQSAPLQDPIKYKIMGYEVSVRRSVAEQIDVIRSDEAKKLLLQENHSDFYPHSFENNFYGTFTENDFRHVALEKRRDIKIALVGNPNCGKSTLFNSATGEHAKVGNYSGVTVDTKKGNLIYKGYNFTVVDLPGTYSISAFSPEERLVRQFIVKEQPDIILNVLDGNNLERNLFLTTQLIDMNVRTVIALNFFDEIENRGDKIDIEKLEKLIGIPIVPTVSTKGVGLNNLFDTIINLYESSEIIDKNGKLIEAIENDELIEKYHHLIELEHKHSKATKGLQNIEGTQHLHEISRHIHINYGNVIEKSIEKIKKIYSVNEGAYDEFTPRYIAIQLLNHDKDIEGFAAKYSNFSEIIKTRDEQEKIIEDEYKTSAANAIVDAKYGFIAGALKETFFPAKEEQTHTVTSKIDKIVTNRFLAYPIFAIIIFLMFEATFSLGQYPMSWIERLVAQCGMLVNNLMPSGILKDLLSDGIIGGVGAVLVFLPNILILYFCMTLLDASGYMARAAFIMDKVMHKIGLHGHSFIPLMMGFGCNVPAIMATRTIENRNNRMVTILVSSFMSCTARLPIFILLVGAFFAKYQALALFAIYFFGIILAAVFAKIFKKFLFNKNETPFVMELPTYRVPTVKYILRETWDKGSQYLKKIGTTILVGSVIIWALGYFPIAQPALFSAGADLQSVPLSENIQGTDYKSAPATSHAENSYLAKIGKFIEPALKPLGYDWKISVALLSGAAAKEVVVSTLGVLYNVDEDNLETTLPQKLQAATCADGSSIYSLATVISLMLFVLIYFPCIATIATIKHETGKWRWAFFVVIYTLILAWLIAFAAYNIVNLQLYQETAVAIIVFISLSFLIKKLLDIKNAKKSCKNCAGC